MKVIKKITTFLILFIIQFSCGQEIDNKKEFEKTIYNILKNSNQTDYQELNTFIHPNIGLLITEKIGVYNRIFKTNCLNENISPDCRNISKLLSERHNNNFPAIIYKSYPKFKNCDSPNKKGLFVNPKDKKDKVIKNIITDQLNEDKEYQLGYADHWNELLILEEKLNKDSIKVMYIWDYEYENYLVENVYIFYLTYIEEKWYLTAIDFASTDCSA